MQRFVKRQSVIFQPIESLPFFTLTNKRARQVLILVASDLIKFKVLVFLSRILTSFCPFWVFVIVKQIDVSLWISYLDNVMTKPIINTRTDARKTDVNADNTKRENNVPEIQD